MASSPAIVCFHMYSLSVSVSDEGFTCDKCRKIVRLTEKILELETRIQTLVEDSKNMRAVEYYRHCNMLWPTPCLPGR